MAKPDRCLGSLPLRTCLPLWPVPVMTVPRGWYEPIIAGREPNPYVDTRLGSCAPYLLFYILESLEWELLETNQELANRSSLWCSTLAYFSLSACVCWLLAWCLLGLSLGSASAVPTS